MQKTVARRLAQQGELSEPAFWVAVHGERGDGAQATLEVPAAARGPPKDGRTTHSADCPGGPRVPAAGRVVVSFDRGDGPAPLASVGYAIPAVAPGHEFWAQLNAATDPIVVQLRVRQSADPGGFELLRVALRVAHATGEPKPPSDKDRALSI